MKVKEFTPACSCGSHIRFSKFYLTVTSSIILVGHCTKCKTRNERGMLVPTEVHCEFTLEWINENYPVDTEFTDNDLKQLKAWCIAPPAS